MLRAGCGYREYTGPPTQESYLGVVGTDRSLLSTATYGGAEGIGVDRAQLWAMVEAVRPASHGDCQQHTAQLIAGRCARCRPAASFR
jgi:hypothetical protein